MKKRKEETKVEATSEDKKVNEEQVVAEKKNGAFSYSAFWIKMFAAAVLLALGLWMIFDHDTSKQIIITASGAAVALLCIARIVYIIRANNISKRFKLVTFVEICIDAVMAIFFLIAGINFQSNKDTKFYDFLDENYRYFIGVVIYLRGVLHFFAGAFFDRKITLINFFINIAFITLGTFCFAYKFTVDKLAWVMMALVLLSALYLGVDGIIHYQKFKGGNNNGEKTVIKEKEIKKEAEASEEVIGDKEIIPNPEVDPEVNREIVN
ncbi:MAG: hypothetical protein ACI35W_07525 [Anaeroplasmataceae bacterium]